MSNTKAKPKWSLHLVAKKRRAALKGKQRILSEGDKLILSFYYEHGFFLSPKAARRLDELNKERGDLAQRCEDLEEKNARLEAENERLKQIVDEKHRSELEPRKYSLVECASGLMTWYLDGDMGEDAPPPDEDRVRRAHKEWDRPLPGARKRGRPAKDEEIWLSQAEMYDFCFWYMNDYLLRERVRREKKNLRNKTQLAK